MDVREHDNHESSSLSQTIRWNSEYSGLGFMACERTTRPIFFSALTFLVLFVLRQKVHKKSLEILSPATPPLPNPSLQPHPSIQRTYFHFTVYPGLKPGARSCPLLRSWGICFTSSSSFKIQLVHPGSVHQ